MTQADLVRPVVGPASQATAVAMAEPPLLGRAWRRALLPYGVAAVVACIPLVAVVASLQLPLFFRLPNMTDDAFYYLVPALNIAQGLGPTADGQSLTSGFHPLWMGVVAVMAKLCGCDRLTFLNEIVVAGAILHTATAVLIFGIGRRFLPLFLAGLFALLYDVHGANLLGSMQAMESPLLAFLLVLFVLVASKPSERAAHRWALGGILGLVFLARTDAALLIIGYLVLKAALQLLRHESPLAVVRSSVPTAVGAAITALPWFVFAWHTYGTIMQNSMLVKLLWRARAFEGVSFMDSARFTLSMLRAWLVSATVADQSFVYVALAGAVLLCIALLRARAPLAALGAGFAGAEGLLLAAAALALYVLQAGLFYAVRFDRVFEWYFVPAHVFWAVFGIVVATTVTRLTSPRWTRAKVHWTQAVVGCVLIAATLQDGIRSAMQIMQPAYQGAGYLEFNDWIDQNTPAEAVFASRDSGALSYFLDRTVVNLDGLNNDDILAVSKNRSMEQYIDARHIGYIIGSVAYTEPDSDFARDVDPTFAKRRLQVVFNIASGSHNIFLYRVLPA